MSLERFGNSWWFHHLWFSGRSCVFVEVYRSWGGGSLTRSRSSWKIEMSVETLTYDMVVYCKRPTNNIVHGDFHYTFMGTSDITTMHMHQVHACIIVVANPTLAYSEFQFHVPCFYMAHTEASRPFRCVIPYAKSHSLRKTGFLNATEIRCNIFLCTLFLDTIFHYCLHTLFLWTGLIDLCYWWWWWFRRHLVGSGSDLWGRFCKEWD